LTLDRVLIVMQYQIFVKSRSARHFVASVIGMPTVSVDGDTELEAISNVKAALNSQLSKGKIVTIDLDEPPKIDLTSTTPMQHAGILETDPTFDDWMDKLAEIRRSANEINDDNYNNYWQRSILQRRGFANDCHR
jgi:predicted RNase H-like HicB family nuclease